MPEPWALIRRAAADRTSGASQIARDSAMAIVHLPPERAPEAVRLLVRGHPEMGPLWRLATDILSADRPDEGAQRFLAALEADDRAAEVLAPALPPWLLTISYSSAVLATVARARVRLLSCMRSDPGGEGVRTAEEASVRAQVIEDNEALRLVPAGAVVVGVDAITPSFVVNKVKTKALAEAAGLKRIPVYAVAGGTKFVAVELPVESPFERVPLELFTAVATPDGLLDPDDARAHAALAEVHPELAAMP